MEFFFLKILKMWSSSKILASNFFSTQFSWCQYPEKFKITLEICFLTICQNKYGNKIPFLKKIVENLCHKWWWHCGMEEDQDEDYFWKFEYKVFHFSRGGARLCAIYIRWWWSRINVPLLFALRLVVAKVRCS